MQERAATRGGLSQFVPSNSAGRGHRVLAFGGKRERRGSGPECLRIEVPREPVGSGRAGLRRQAPPVTGPLLRIVLHAHGAGERDVAALQIFARGQPIMCEHGFDGLGHEVVCLADIREPKALLL